MAGATDRSGRRKPRRGHSPDSSSSAEYALEAAHTVEAKLKKAMSRAPESDGDEPLFEVLWYGEHGGHSFSFIHVSKNGGKRLSEREAEIAAYKLRGLSAKEIATKLRRSVHTVEHHIERLRGKLGADACGPLHLLLRPEVLVHLGCAETNPEGESGREQSDCAEGKPGRRRECQVPAEVACNLVRQSARRTKSTGKVRGGSRCNADPSRQRKGKR